VGRFIYLKAGNAAILISCGVFYVCSTELFGMDVGPFTFSYAELRTATNDFNSTNKLGEGGFGLVYKVNYFSKLH